MKETEEEKPSFWVNALVVLMLIYVLGVVVAVPVALGWEFVGHQWGLKSSIIMACFILGWNVIMYFSFMHFGEDMNLMLPDTYYTMKHKSEDVIGAGALLLFSLLWPLTAAYMIHFPGHLGVSLLLLWFAYLVVSFFIIMLAELAQAITNFIVKKIDTKNPCAE